MCSLVALRDVNRWFVPILYFSVILLGSEQNPLASLCSQLLFSILGNIIEIFSKIRLYVQVLRTKA